MSEVTIEIVETRSVIIEVSNAKFTAAQAAQIEQNKADINTEVARATAAEGALAAGIVNETNRATAAEDENALDIFDEVTRATAAEGVNAAAIVTETNRATAAEVTNATDIAAQIKANALLMVLVARIIHAGGIVSNIENALNYFVTISKT